MRISMVGDALVTQGLDAALETGDLDPSALLLQDCDVAVCNLETLFHDYEHPANAFRGGIWLRCPPSAAADLRAAGFSAVARANNHALDYGTGGLDATSEALARHGIVWSGVGEDYPSSFAPARIRTAAGTMALVSACSTLPPGFASSRPRGPHRGRPGVAPLRFARCHRLKDDDYAQLCHALGLVYGSSPSPQTQRIRLDGLLVERGDGAPQSNSIADEEDLRALVDAVAAAKESADVVVVSLHCHEADTAEEYPPTFMVAAAHAVAEAGASVVFGHGPHRLRGMEVHEGVPILYSLGNFIFQYDSVGAVPDDARREQRMPVDATDDEVAARGLSFAGDDRFWEGIAARATFDGDQCTELDLVPFTLRQSGGVGKKGLPVRAYGERAEEMLARFASLSPGVTVQTVDGCARIQVGVLDRAAP